ncbi:MAG TPA: methyltransferase domain-containing protein [Bryobacteraceae bacterium]|nr:methyltransferase domain-containing protein [Bryobacteraceae bacterium]
MSTMLWLGLTAALLCAQPDPEARWQAFLAWLSARPPDSKPANLLRPYRAELIRMGMSPVEAERELDRLGHLAFTRPNGAKVLWNKVYGGRDPIFVQTPNALLASAIQDRKPGRALDFGMGQGRNAVFLAMQGWDVTGFDPSDEAIRQAQANAAKASVKIRALVSTDDRFDFGVAQWDLIAMTYIRSPTARDAERIRRALAPGGVFVYENGSDRHNELLKLFLPLRILRFEDMDAFPDWNPTEKIRLERLVAEKPRE